MTGIGQTLNTGQSRNILSYIFFEKVPLVRVIKTWLAQYVEQRIKEHFFIFLRMNEYLVDVLFELEVEFCLFFEIEIFTKVCKNEDR